MTRPTPDYLSLFILSAVAASLPILLIRLTSLSVGVDLIYLAVAPVALGISIGASSFRFATRNSNSAGFPLVSSAILVIILSFAPSRLPIGESFGDIQSGGHLSLAFFSAYFIAISALTAYTGLALARRVSQTGSDVKYLALSGAILGPLIVFSLLYIVDPANILPGASLVILAAFVLTFLTPPKNRSSATPSGAKSLVVGIITLLISSYNIGSLFFGPAASPVSRGMDQAAVSYRPGSIVRLLKSDQPDSIKRRTANRGISSRRFDNPLERIEVMKDRWSHAPCVDFGSGQTDLEYLGYKITVFGVHLFAPNRALVINPGGGEDILAFISVLAEDITVLETSSELVRMVDVSLAGFSGSVFSFPGVTTHITSPRNFAVDANFQYDFIRLSRQFPDESVANDINQLNTDFSLTVEAFQGYFKSLDTIGILSVSCLFTDSNQTPALSLISTIYNALSNDGHTKPRDHIALLSADGIATILVRKKIFSASESNKLLAEALKLDFATIWLPGSHALFPTFISYYLSQSANPEVLRRKIGFFPQPRTDRNPHVVTATLAATQISESPAAESGFLTGKNRLPLWLFIISALMTLIFVAFPCSLFPPGGHSPLLFMRSHFFAISHFKALAMGSTIVFMAALTLLTMITNSAAHSLTIGLVILTASFAFGYSGAGRLLPTSKDRVQQFSASLALALILFGIAVGGADLVKLSLGHAAIIGYCLLALVTAAIGLGAGTTARLCVNRIRSDYQEISRAWWISYLCGVISVSAVASGAITFYLGLEACMLVGASVTTIAALTSLFTWNKAHG